MVATLMEKQGEKNRDEIDGKLSSEGYESFRRQWLNKKDDWKETREPKKTE